MTNEQRELVERLRNRHLLGDCQEAATTIEQLAERCGRLEEALREYGNHVSPCATERSPKLLKEFGLMRWPCTCGFDAALATAETEVKP